MGASDFGYRLARQFGLNVRETRAGLVPFVFSGAVQELMERLSGISLHAALSTSEVTFADGICSPIVGSADQPLCNWPASGSRAVAFG